MARRKGGTLSRVAGRLCQNPKFQAWCGAKTAAEAAEWVRLTCRVESRADIDHSHVATQLFHDLVRRPYSELSE